METDEKKKREKDQPGVSEAVAPTTRSTVEINEPGPK